MKKFKFLGEGLTIPDKRAHAINFANQFMRNDISRSINQYALDVALSAINSAPKITLKQIERIIISHAQKRIEFTMANGCIDVIRADDDRYDGEIYDTSTEQDEIDLGIL